jgi:hypothetical protein
MDAGPLRVASLAELRAREPEILARLRALPNGERLFLIHPLRALADAGVALDDEATAAILRLHPNLAAMPALPYDAVKSSRLPQRGHVRLLGLFRWEDP